MPVCLHNCCFLFLKKLYIYILFHILNAKNCFSFIITVLDMSMISNNIDFDALFFFCAMSDFKKKSYHSGPWRTKMSVKTLFLLPSKVFTFIYFRILPYIVLEIKQKYKLTLNKNKIYCSKQFSRILRTEIVGIRESE